MGRFFKVVSFSIEMAVETTPAANSLPCQCLLRRDECETMRKSDAVSKLVLFAKPEIFAEPVDLVHPLVQDCDDANVTI